MARVKDLWFSEVKDPNDPEGKRKIKTKTKRHPDRGGSKNAKRWLAVWIGPDGREVTKAFHVKEKAKAYARDQESDVERGEYIGPKAGRELFGPLTMKWIRLRRLSGASAIRYKSVNRLHVEPTFGRRQVRSIRPSEIAEWLRDLEKTRGASVCSLAFHIVRGTLEVAVADGMRKDNPTQSRIIPRVQADVTQRTVWSSDKMWSVIDQHPAAYQSIPILAAGCGLRQGEVFAIAEEDFDFDAGMIRVERQIAHIGKQVLYKLPKRGKTREVPISPGVAQVIRAYMETYPPVKTTLPWMKEDGTFARDPLTVRLLFVWRGELLAPPLGEGVRTNADRGRQRSAEGLNLRMSNYDVLVWKVALARAEVIPAPTNNGRGALVFAESREDGMHALRHWFSTTLQDAGVSLAGVMDFMGHSRKGVRIPVTLGAYGHVTEETWEAARCAVDAALFRLRIVQDQSRSGTGTEQAG